MKVGLPVEFDGTNVKEFKRLVTLDMQQHWWCNKNVYTIWGAEISNSLGARLTSYTLLSLKSLVTCICSILV